MPEWLKGDLAEYARAHDRSLNDEIVLRLKRPIGPKLRRALLDMAPESDDPRSDLEVAQDIDWLTGSDLAYR